MLTREQLYSKFLPLHTEEKGHWNGTDKNNNKVNIRHEDLLEYAVSNFVSYYVSRMDKCKMGGFLFIKNQ